MPPPQRNIRIPEAVWREIQERAEAEGISAAAYIREAVIARIYYERAVEGDRALARALGLARRKQ